MTQQTTTDRDVLWRRALYGGLFSSAGVIFGWLAWFVLQTALLQRMAVLISPIVGVVVGWAYEFIKDYHATARALQKGEAAPKDVAVANEPAASKATLWTFAVTFLVATAVSVVGDQLSAYLRPFFISVLTFFPAGVFFTWGLSSRSPAKPSHPYEKLLCGFFVGVLVFIVSVPLLLLPGVGWQDGSFTWSYPIALFGWWGLLGTVYGLFWGSPESPRPLAPLGATAVLIVLMVGLAVGSSAKNPSTYWLMRGLTALTSAAMEQPGMPAHVVEDAEAIYSEKNPEAASTSSQSSSGPKLAKTLCPATLVVRPIEPPPQDSQPEYHLPNGHAIKPLARNEQIQRIELVEPQRSEAHSALCRELQKGARSDLVRSWLVLLLFSLGLGLAKVIELRLRPSNYHGSALEQRDLQLFYAVVAILLGALVYIHWAT